MRGGRLQRLPVVLIVGLALLVAPRLALADGGCRGCSESMGCVWVCTFTVGVFAVPAWLLFTISAALLNPRFRRLRPHLVSLPLSFLGILLALRLADAAPLVFWLFPLLPLLWYFAIAKLRVLRWFTAPKRVRRTTDWRRAPADR
jgi:hypothetical protein